jgi:hypothetical protein
MSTEALIRRFHDLACVTPETTRDADSLIGFFQAFRPDGAGITDLYDDLDVGDALLARLERLYMAAGDDRRPQGGRDAYFVIRTPPMIDPDEAGQLATLWLEGVRDLATSLGDAETAEVLNPMPRIRVLEGLPPKHPKEPTEKSVLLRTLQENASILVERIDAGPYAPILRPAYYFTACDTMLRDYLMWPLYAAPSGLDDPLESYFELWRHGVKYRIFGETQVDLYLPRQRR